MTEVEQSLWDDILRISDDLISMYQAVNPRLFLISNKAIRRKAKDLLNLVKDINRKSKHAQVRTKSNLDNKFKKLFNVSACTCWLETESCNNVQVYCKLVGCQEKHILCLCPTYLKVPLEERAYLGDQRLKVGS